MVGKLHTTFEENWYSTQDQDRYQSHLYAWRDDLFYDWL